MSETVEDWLGHCFTFKTQDSKQPPDASTSSQGDRKHDGGVHLHKDGVKKAETVD